MQTETAATKSFSGQPARRFLFFRKDRASWSATKPPVIAAVRVPPSACSTSQSTWTVLCPSEARSTTARSERPISRWISCVRPDCLPRAASRSVRVLVARGSMPYSAVTQPLPVSRRKGGTRSSTDAVQSTRVSPNSTSTEPSACRVRPRVSRTVRSSSGRRPLGLPFVLIAPASLARSQVLAQGRLELGDRLLHFFVGHAQKVHVGGAEILHVGGKLVVGNRLRAVLRAAHLLLAPDHRHQGGIVAVGSGAGLGERGQGIDRLVERLAEQRVHHLALVDRPPQAVGAKQHDVVFRQALACRLEARRGEAAEALQQAGALGVGGDRFLADWALFEEELPHRVVARARHDPALAEKINAAVAGVRPVGDAVLDEAGDEHRARHVGELARLGLAQDRDMGGHDRARQENVRVRKLRPRFQLERLREQIGRDLRRDLAVQVPAQAVGDHHEQRLRRRPMADAVLVDPARPEAAILGDREFHRSPYAPLCLHLPNAFLSWSTSPGSLRCSGGFSPSSASCSENTLCWRSTWSRRRQQSTASSSSAEYLPAQARRAGSRLSFARRSFAACGGAPAKQAYIEAPTE